MKITIITMGARGDVQPFVALGMGLVQVGHEVTICTSDRFESLIRERGLHYGYMNDHLLKITETDAGRQVKAVPHERSDRLFIITSFGKLILETPRV